MPMCRLPPARLLLLGLLLLGAGLAAQSVFQGPVREPVGVEGAGGRTSGAVDEEVGRPALEGFAAPAPEPEITLTLRLVDEQGRPLAFTYARVTVRQRDARGARQHTVRAPSDAEGLVRIDLPGSTVLRVEVELAGTGEVRSVATWPEGRAAAEVQGQRFVVPGVAWLQALTVDGEGNPSPGRRVLYRAVAAVGAKPRVGGAERSEGDGSLLLGPFDVGAALEIWADARGQVTTSEAPETGWQRVVMGPEVVKIPFPAPWPLRLRILGVAPDAEVMVSMGRHEADPIVPSRLVDGVWTQPASAPRVGGDIVIGPLPDGRTAYLRNVRPEEDPLDVELEPGTPLRGRCLGEDLPGGLEGVVRASGRGWVVEVPLHADGTFAFPGLPPRGANLWVEAREPRTRREWAGGTPTRSVVRCDVTVQPAFRIKGCIDPGENELATPTRAYVEIAGEHSKWWHRVWRVELQEFELLVPADATHLSCTALLASGTAGTGGAKLVPVEAARTGLVLQVDGRNAWDWR